MSTKLMQFIEYDNDKTKLVEDLLFLRKSRKNWNQNPNNLSFASPWMTTAKLVMDVNAFLVERRWSVLLRHGGEDEKDDKSRDVEE